MPISDLCKKMPVSVDKDASLEEAAHSMKRNRVGGLIVLDCDENKTLLGIVTDRDLALKGIGENRSPSSKVVDIMSRNLLTVTAGAGVAAVIERMAREGVRRAVVVDDKGVLCGVVSSDDILRLLAQELNGLGNLVRNQVEEELDQSFWDQVIL